MRHKRLVKIIAVDRRYKSTPYPYVPIFDGDLNTYLTGQHIDNKIPETRGNLTTAEMKGDVQLSSEKADRFPFVINPLNEYPIINGMILDITKEKGKYLNPRDGALYNMWKNHGYKIAMSRISVKKGYDFFYIKDEYEEATIAVSTDDLIYEAMKLIKEKTNVGNYADIAMLISYRVKGFFLNTENKPEVVIQSKLLQVCKEKPAEVIECFKKSAEEELQVLKYAKYNIIQKRGNDFFDGDKFIGRTVRDVLSFMRDPINVGLVDKWQKLYENRVKPVIYNPKSDEGEAKNDNANASDLEYADKIKGMELEGLKKECAIKKIYWGNYKNETDKDKLIELLLEK